MHTYLFDVKLFATFRIKAADEATARRMLADAVAFCGINAGETEDGQTLTADASADGELDLVEIDGEAV